MQEHQSLIQDISDFISIKYPNLGKVIGFIGAGGLMALGVAIPDIHELIPGIYKLEIPKVFMQMIQLYLGLTGFIIALATFLNKDKKK